MLENWVDAQSACATAREDTHERTDHPATSGEAGVHLRAPIDPRSGAPPPAEHGTSVRAAGQSANAGLAFTADPHARSGLGPVGCAECTARRLQNASDGSLDGASRRGVCVGSVAPRALERGLASAA